MKKLIIIYFILLTTIVIKAQTAHVCFIASNDTNSTLSVGSGVVPSGVTSADFNGDGILDLAVADAGAGSNNVSIFIGSNSNVFAAAVNYTVEAGPISITHGDFNGDGKIDLAVACNSLNFISILNGSGNGLFAPSVSYTVGGNPIAITSSDFNKDGIADLAVANYGTNNASVLFGTSTGTFGFSSNYPLGASPTSITTGDFNGDGNVDLATANYSPNTFSIMFGNSLGIFSGAYNYGIASSVPFVVNAGDFNGDGNDDLAMIINTNTSNLSVLIAGSGGVFSNIDNYLVGTDPRAISIADYNGDGNKDIATTNYAANSVSVLLGSITGTFVAPVSYGVGLNPYGITSNDINMDGKIDIIVANQNSFNVSILKGIGNGAFTAPVTSEVGAGPRSVISADFNGDGHADLATANNSANTISVLLGSATGTFATAVDYNVGSNPSSIAVADFNGDGKVDLAVTISVTIGSDKVVVLMGSGSGTFSWTGSYPVGSSPRSLTPADFNNDGNIDLAVVNLFSSDVSILLGSATGTFAAAINYTVAYDPNSITTNDFNGDGNADLAVCGTYSTTILLGNGSGAFISNISYGIAGLSIKSADFNGDGKVDLALANNSSNDISIYLGNGNGTFVYMVNYSVGSWPSAIAVADFNADGILDLAATNYYSQDISILMGQDFGFFSSAVNYGVGLNPQSITAADFNGDGNPDIAINNDNSNNVYILTSTIVTLTLTSANSVCIGNNVSLVASGNTNNYVWSTGSTSSSISVSPTLNTSYTVTNTNIQGCSIKAVKTISVNPIPVITAADGVVCGGGSFTISPNGANTYTISGGSYIVNPPITTTYSITGTSAAGCVNNNALLVTVSAQSSLTLSVLGSTTVCTGDSLNLTVSGAATYTWNAGIISNTFAATPLTNITYSVIGASGTCIDSMVINVTVNPTPTISITSTNSVCVNSSATINALGASTYTWNTGSNTASVNITPTITTTYTVIGTDINNCSNSQTISVTVDNTCADVWPGDANSDGIADNLDVLELGLHYAQTGTPRATISNLWQSYYSANWSGTITNGKNLNHSNCNGDGIINDDDTLAIYTNYSLTHAFKPEQTTTSPLLTIVPDQLAVAKGTWGTASINLGNVTTPISNINGIAFTINFDKTLFETDSVWIDYSTSFINASNQNLKFRKRNFINGKLFTATTHTINGNVNGYGKIATLHYKIKSTLATDNVLNLSVSQANQSYANGYIAPLTAGSATLMAIGASVGINELTDGNYLSILPNPANDILVIELNTTNEINATIEITNTLGQVVLSSSLKNNKEVLNITHLSNGVYFVKVLSTNKQIGFKKIVVQR